jgi:hypothetical protein
MSEVSPWRNSGHCAPNAVSLATAQMSRGAVVTSEEHADDERADVFLLLHAGLPTHVIHKACHCDPDSSMAFGAPSLLKLAA